MTDAYDILFKYEHELVTCGLNAANVDYDKLAEVREKFAKELAKVTGEDVAAIGKVMAHQDNRATQYPMFVVYETVERSVGDGQGESKRKDSDSIEKDWLCETCQELDDDGKELPDYCSDCDSECFWNCEESQEPNLNAGVFFTAEACQKHIDENDYHYNKPVVYGIGSWRNPEMQAVQKHILEVAGEEIPSCYT